MNESKKDWKVVDGYYPGFLNIVGASYTVSIVTSATDLTIEDYVNRTNDAHLMAAAPKLLAALVKLQNAAYNVGGEHITDYAQLIKAADEADDVIAALRGQQ